MDNNYKIGDRVVCVDDRDSTNLSVGFEYKIVDINQYGNIQVTEGGDEPLPHFYRPCRFDVIAKGQNTKKNTKKNTVENKTKTFDPAKNYKTKDGKEFKFIGMSREQGFPVVGEILEDGVEWFLSTWTLEGKHYEDGDSDNDLVELPDEIEIKIGGVTFRIFDDRSILIDGDIATDPLSNEEIDAFIEALKTFRD